MPPIINPENLFSFFSTTAPVCYLEDCKHSHDEYEINVILSGSCSYCIGNDEIELRPGMSLIFGRNQRH